ncbi:hypothetical protein Sjap_011126 [Stephania japonica]|uniref:Uncharacterized protein n=1 Tax=Stephania japonica TaxID=461633 RepID=A0AAP0JB04_9MAGN
MQRQSPPKHRHDGTSPLPLGMDWSPPPKKWLMRSSRLLGNFEEGGTFGWSKIAGSSRKVTQTRRIHQA